jgi:hypothetical protein
MRLNAFPFILLLSLFKELLATALQLFMWPEHRHTWHGFENVTGSFIYFSQISLFRILCTVWHDIRKLIPYSLTRLQGTLKLFISQFVLFQTNKVIDHE